MTPLAPLAQAQAAQQQASFLHHFDTGALSAALIIGIIGAAVLGIVLVSVVAQTVQRVVMVRESNRLILELLKRGHSADEIERIVYGGQKFGHKVGRFFGSVRRKFRGQGVGAVNRRAMPPIK
jgi:hypothetical protein